MIIGGKGLCLLSDLLYITAHSRSPYRSLFSKLWMDICVCVHATGAGTLTPIVFAVGGGMGVCEEQLGTVIRSTCHCGSSVCVYTRQILFFSVSSCVWFYCKYVLYVVLHS